MFSTRFRIAIGVSVTLALASLNIAPAYAESTKSQIVNRELDSKNFANNKIGTSSVRSSANRACTLAVVMPSSGPSISGSAMCARAPTASSIF